MNQKHPTLLVATEFAPNASGGGPAIVRQMLKGWPTDKLFWWCCLADEDRRFGQKVCELRCARIPGKLYPVRKFRRLKSLLLERVWTPRASRHLERTLQEVRPDAVWVIPHQWAIPPVSQVLGEHRSRYHITVQDYPDALATRRRFGAARCARMAALVDRLYAGAATRDATSHPMIADLRGRTGQDATQMLHAGLEAADFNFLERNIPPPASPLRIAYAGTIVVEEAFEIFVSAVGRIRASLAGPVQLHFFGDHSYASRKWFREQWMVEHGNVPEATLLKELRQCQWGFSPMALDDADPRYNRFSFPTKFITYLAAGLPIITLGHPESSVMKMAAQYRVGPSASQRAVEALAIQLRTALAEPAPWQLYGSEILRCARTEFDAARMRKVLHDSFGPG